MTQQQQDGQRRAIAIKGIVGDGIIADDTSRLIEKAKDIAMLAKKMIDRGNMAVDIAGNKYINVEGWSSLGILLGVFPRIDSVQKIPTDDGSIAFLAIVSLYSKSGTLITTATAMCSNKEQKRRGAEEYVIHSMAQTRATGRAFRQAFGWIMTYENFSTTPAEEMDGVMQKKVQKTPVSTPKKKKPQQDTPKSIKEELENFNFDQKSKVDKAKEEIKKITKK